MILIYEHHFLRVCHNDGFSFFPLVFCLVKWCIYWKITCLHTSLGQKFSKFSFKLSVCRFLLSLTVCVCMCVCTLECIIHKKRKIMNNVLWNVICTKSIYVIRQDYPFIYIYIFILKCKEVYFLYKIFYSTIFEDENKNLVACVFNHAEILIPIFLYSHESEEWRFLLLLDTGGTLKSIFIIFSSRIYFFFFFPS